MIFVGTRFIPVHISRHQSGGDKPHPYDSVPPKIIAGLLSQKTLLTSALSPRNLGQRIGQNTEEPGI
jgi:hypothetical protein